MKMLRLMGVPVIEAPCQAEAQCTELARAGLVYATVTEDMDALPLRTPVMLRGLNSKDDPIVEINFDEMLNEL